MLFRLLEEELDLMPAEAHVPAQDNRREAIERRAYLLAESRGFAPGHELEDWLTAERQRLALERAFHPVTYWL
ncbi:MAG TPA: DUF2934 domain-containing protein [Steroidobacteraceae bacterium]|jgi:hypothetical protein|nr:DUF2934 domain-containing protein [Steroidobacteraceae bacterium]